MTHLTVSVVISTYNRARLLPEALDSLFSQTRVPDEIIVVDDGSTDDTQQVLATYGSSVKAIYQENKGLPGGRNTGLRAATGDLIAFLDSDDVLPPDSIALRLNFLEQNPAAYAVYGLTCMTDMQNNVLGWVRKPPLLRGNLFAEAACRTVFTVHSIMFKRECLAHSGFFDENLRVYEDFDFWLRFCALYPVEAIDETVAYYRVHEGMIVMTQKEKMIHMGIIAQRRAFDMEAFKNLSSDEQARVYSVHASQYALLGENGSARHWYWQAIRCAPAKPRNYLLWMMTLGGKRVFNLISHLYNRLPEQTALPPV